MIIKEIMTKVVAKAHPSVALHDVWKLLYKKHVHGVPIIDEKNRLIGIISEEDILTKLYPDYGEAILDMSTRDFSSMEEKSKSVARLKAKDIMNKTVYLTHEDEPVMKALSKMIIYEVRQLPVIDEKKRLIGMVSKGDVFDVIFKKYLRK